MPVAKCKCGKPFVTAYGKRAVINCPACRKRAKAKMVQYRICELKEEIAQLRWDKKQLQKKVLELMSKPNSE